jgi:hypothetical protein
MNNKFGVILALFNFSFYCLGYSVQRRLNNELLKP